VAIFVINKDCNMPNISLQEEKKTMSLLKYPDDLNLKLIIKEAFRELIDENLHHIIKECRKKEDAPVVAKDVMYTETRNYMKDEIRKEIAKECRDDIWSVVNYETDNFMSTTKAVDKIMDIIRGENEA